MDQETRNRLTRLRIAGYKSFRDATLELRPLNVLIGANGSGKSNVFSCFRLLAELAQHRLQLHVGQSGGARALLHHGANCTPAIELEVDFSLAKGVAQYSCRLVDAQDDNFVFDREAWQLPMNGPPIVGPAQSSSGQRESQLSLRQATDAAAEHIQNLLVQCRTYQFHDTSSTADIRRTNTNMHAGQRLLSDAGNLAAFLFRLKQHLPNDYRRIVDAIQQVAPFFDDFVLEPNLEAQTLLLNWRQRNSDYILGPHQISDGLLRFMAICALLLQPRHQLPRVILIDEPELGLHPAALELLGALIRQAAHHTQVIVATQSSVLVNEFDPDAIVVLDRDERESRFHRLSKEALASWLEDYSVSELWERNIVGGGPF